MIDFIAALLLAGRLAAAQDSVWVSQSVPEATVYGSTCALNPQQTWIDMINSSRKSLELAAFYIESKKGQALEPVLYAIRSAAERGVDVKILADRAFYKKMPSELDALRATGGIAVRIIDFSKAGGGVMHAKYFIVDGEDVFCGSQNMDWRSLSQIHEIGLRIKNARIATVFRRVFYTDWEEAGGDVPRLPGAEPLSASSTETLVMGGVRVGAYAVFGPPDFLPRHFGSEIDELMRLIDGARKSFSAQVMTYSLSRRKGGKWRLLDDALRRAGARGVSVRLIFADWSMKERNAADIKSLARAPGVKVKISSLPQLPAGYIPYARVEHCKYAVIDGAVSVVSTSNWEHDYFYASRDAAVVLLGERPAYILGGIFEKAWNGPYVKPAEKL
ncbi:MAG: phospholipase D-like domain-containing protein [Elusimicrobiales bacterium]